MENTYWNNKGRYQAELDRLLKLIPAMGNCDTVAGELIRAANRIAYDLYNNGMGNNTSGAVNFLADKGAIDGAAHAAIYPYTRGQLYDGHYDGDALQVAVERMIDSTVEFILARPELETQPNTEDMFDYEEPFQHWCEDCGDEVDGWQSVCRHCEESYWEEEDEDEEYEY